MIKVIYKRIFAIFLTLLPFLSFSADYYWIGGNGTTGGTYAAPLSGEWAVLDNWRDASTGGNIPSSAPSLNDNVFINLPNAVTVISIPFSEIFSNDFNFVGRGTIQFLQAGLNTINSNGSFSWNGQGKLTMGANANINIKGSLFVSNNAVFDIGNINCNINMIATAGNHTISTNNSTLNFRNFNISPTNSSVSYSFLSNFRNFNITINSGNILLNDLSYTVNELIADANSTKNINFGNSKLNIAQILRLGGTGFSVIPGLAEFVFGKCAAFSYTSNNAVKFNRIEIDSSGTQNCATTIRSTAPPSNLGFQKIDLKNDLNIIGSGISVDTVRYINNVNLLLPVTNINAINNFSIISKAIITNSACTLPTLQNFGVGNVSLRLGGSNITTQTLSTQNIHVTNGSLTVNLWQDKGNNLNITNVGVIPTNDYYWVNATNNRLWSVPANWRVGSCTGTIPSCPPQAADNVIVDGCGPGLDRIIMDINGAVKNITWTPNVAAGTVLLSGTGTLEIVEDFDIQKNGLTFAHTGQLVFSGQNSTITTGTTTISSKIKLNASGTVTLNGNLNVNNELAHNYGRFFTQGFNITARKFTSGDEEGIYLGTALCKPNRTLDLGASTINITENGTGSHFTIYSGNLTLIPNTSTINITGTGTSNQTVTATFYSICQNNIQQWNNINFTGNGNFTQSLNCIQGIQRTLFKNIRFSTNGRTFSNLTYDTLFLKAGKTYNFAASANNIQHTINKNIIIEGQAPCNALTFIQGGPFPLIFRKTSGSLDFDKTILSNITATGGATFNATQSVDAGGVTGFNFTLPEIVQDYYWNNPAGGNWDDCNNWSVGSPSGPSPTSLPSPVTNVLFSIPVNGVISITATSFCRNMTWDAAAGLATFNGDSPLYVFGSMVLNNTTRLKWDFNGLIYFISDALANNIDTKGQIFNNNIHFVGKGNYLLNSDLKVGNGSTSNSYYTIFLDNGGLITNNFNIEAGTFTSTTSNSRQLSLGSSTINLFLGGWSVIGTNLNFNAGTSNININSNFTTQAIGLDYYNVNFNGNGIRDILVYTSGDPNTRLPIYNKVTFTNNGTINGNHIFDTLSFSTGRTYKVASFSTQTIRKTLIGSGSPCEFTTIQSTIAGSNAGFFRIPGDDISIYQVNLKDISGLSTNPLTGQTTTSQYNATGNSTSNGNTPGWTIGDPQGFIFGFSNGRTDSLLCTDFPYTIPVNTFFNPLTYLWGDGSTNSVFVANSPGRYFLTVTYNNNCTYSDSINLFLNDSTFFNIEPRNPSCYNILNGSVEVKPGDSQVHSYIWKNLPDTTAKISGLGKGTYEVTVNKGICTKKGTAQLFSDTIKVSLSPTDPGCLNDDGSILATVTNAQGNVSYTWSAPSVGNNNPATGLSGGTYSVTVTDDSSCVATEDTTLIFVPLPAITFGPFPDLCENDPTSIDLRPFANPAGGIFEGNGVSGFSFTATSAGAGIQNISYIISDSKGCKDTSTAPLLVKTISTTSLNEEICELDSFTVGTSVFKNSGNFTVTLVNSIGCDSIINLNLLVRPLPDTTIANVSECEGRTVTLPDGTQFTSNGSHDITLSNIYTCDSVVRYLVSFIPTIRDTVSRAICDGDVFVFGTQNLTTAGTFVETFNSYLNCDSVVTLNLIVNPLPAITVIDVQGCEGKSVTLPDGTVFLTDGFKDYIFPNYLNCDSTVRYSVKFVSIIYESVSDTICANQTRQFGTQTLNTSGIYTEPFISFFGCDSIVTLTLTVNPLPAVFDILLTPCEGDTATLLDGSKFTTNTVKSIIIPNFQGCDSTIRYTVNFIPTIRVTKDTAICEGQSFTFGTQTLSSGGTFTETFSAINTCDSVVTLNLSIISLKIAIDNAIICQDTNAKISFTSSGVQNISWFKDNVNLGLSTNTITVNQAGTYYAVARQSTACFDTTNSLTLSVKPTPVINLGLDKTICQGDTATFDATYPGATHIWNNNKTTPIISEKTSGTYIVTLTFNGCQFRDSAILTVKPLPIVNLGPDINACVDSSVTLSPGNIPGNYTWNNGSTGKTLTVNQDGQYSLKINDGLCQNSDSISVVFDQTIPTFELGPDTIVCLNTFITIGAQPSNADNFIWNTGESTPFIDVTETATYQLTASNQCGIYTDTVYVERDNCNCGVFVPNAFSPNGDGLNELAVPIVTCILQNYSFSIFNRWGEKIFESNEIGQGWDGIYKNQKQPTDNYIFYLNYQLVDSDKQEEQHGSLMLLR